jgi:hypothetical protein
MRYYTPYIFVKLAPSKFGGNLMKHDNSNKTNHAIEQMTRRDIPHEALDLLESYGESIKCRDGGRKIAFGRMSRTLIRQELGRAKLKEITKYRRVYAVICDERIVTVARSKKSLIR